jgi:hypothetical protein
MKQALSMRHAESTRSFHLAFGNRQQARAVVFGLIGGVVQTKADDPCAERSELDPDGGKPKENDVSWIRSGVPRTISM